MNVENQRLKEMLSQVSNNYSVLHNHLVTLMQQQQTRGADSAQENEVTTTTTPKKEDKFNLGNTLLLSLYHNCVCVQNNSFNFIGIMVRLLKLNLKRENLRLAGHKWYQYSL